MVVILLLPPYSTNGCDGRSKESSSPATSTTSTGDTAIPTNDYKQGKRHQEINTNNKSFEDYNNNNQQTASYYYTVPLPEPPAEFIQYTENINCQHPYIGLWENTSRNKYNSASPSPPPLPKSKPPDYVAERRKQFYQSYDIDTDPSSEVKICANIVPKPPRYRSQSHPTLATIPEYSLQECEKEKFETQPPPAPIPPPPTSPPITVPAAISSIPTVSPFYMPNSSYLLPQNKSISKSKSYKNSNYVTNTTNYVRHVTRVNFYDIDTSQVEYESKDYDGDDNGNLTLDDDNNTEALTKEEEWITKRKTELTTTRQIETHVKRQVVFEDGKVVEDSGPIVSTNTTEDTDKQETETTEKRDLGLPVALNPNEIKHKGALQYGKEAATAASEVGVGGELAELKNAGGTLVKSIVPRPADGLVREINEKRVVSHEETKDYFETEDVKHMGDFSDEAFVKTVTSGVDNVEELLLSPEYQKQLVSRGPCIVADKTKSYKTIDSENIQKRCLAQEDGRIITESKKTTEHEVIVDDELPDNKSVESAEKIKTQEVNQRYFKQRDEQYVDTIQDGKVVNTEMKYAAETMHMENDNMLERPGDWDSLSDRIRKMRKPHNKSVMQHPKGVVLMDRKDALTKRPLDFDKEEETRKGETIKWLESHFGSESTASNDSREDEVDVIEPTKKTYFNVTIKSNQNHTSSNIFYDSNDKNPFSKRASTDGLPAANNGAKYYQGISNWNNRNETTVTTNPANHFASKAFRDDLHASIERNQLKKTSASYSKKDIYIGDNKSYTKPVQSDSYVSREDILQQKRQSLSSQFLARSRQNSRDNLDELDKSASFEESRYISGSRTDLHYGMNIIDKDKRNYTKAELINDIDSPVPPRKNSYIDERAKSYERSYIENTRYNSLRRESQQNDTPLPQKEVTTLERPTVPQRRRNGEKKLRQHSEILSEAKTPLQQVPINVAEPPPDYSPPPRSRSSSPRESYKNQGLRMKSYATSQQQMYTPLSTNEQPREAQTLNRKQNQRTRFARNTPSPPVAPLQHQTLRPNMSTQTTQTTPSTISTSTVASHRSSKMGQAIGNSLRKLVGKLRSASVERKLRMKSKSKSREQSPATATHQEQQNLRTYQQYNVIDSHIGSNIHTTSHDESEEEFNSQKRNHYSTGQEATNKATEHSVYNNATADRRQLLHSSTSHPVGNNRENGYRVLSPKHRYYLGEDPYSSTLYGKENMHDTIKMRNGIPPSSSSHNNGESSTSSHTLGRYQKSNRRMSGSTPNLNQTYRSTQTLPRKLNDHPSVHHYETQTVNIARSNATSKVQNKLRQQQSHHAPVEQRISYQPISQNTGPLKPARTYAKSLNRSKSFSVHAMNGSNDPSPIYMEKLTINNYTNNNLHSSQAYKSNPHLYSSSKENALQQNTLKSPSIVNLISRSQKDLTKIGTIEDITDHYTERQMYSTNNPNNRHVVTKYQYDDRKVIPAIRSGSYIEDDYKYRPALHYQLQQKHSLESRGSVDINKDTASIIRHEEYIRQKRNPPSGSTIIKVRNTDYRK